MRDERSGEDLVSDRPRHRPRVRRRDDLGPRPAAAVQAAPAGQGDPRRRRARRLGREGAARRRLVVDAEAVDARRGDRRRRRRARRHDRAEGRPPRDQLGRARGRGDLRRAAPRRALVRALRGRARAVGRAAASCTACATRASRSSTASCAAGRSSTSRSRPAAGCRRARSPGIATTSGRCSSAGPRAPTPSPTTATRSTSSRRSTSPATRPATTRPTTSASRAASRASSPRPGAGCARPASTRSPRTRPPSGNVDVIVNYTNCVQCGAITAKGGRLTTPEGGNGPHYQRL